MQFGVRAGPVKREIPSTSLRAGSSLRLKSGCAPDDTDGRSARSGGLRVLLLRLSHSGYKVKVPTLVAKYATRIDWIRVKARFEPM